MPIQIQLRRDTAANWAASNPTPALGEPCFETDTGTIKIGDGTTSYNTLSATFIVPVILTAAEYAALSPPNSETIYYIVG